MPHKINFCNMIINIKRVNLYITIILVIYVLKSSVMKSSWSQPSIHYLSHSLIIPALYCLPIWPTSTLLLFSFFLPDLEQHLFILLCLSCHIMLHLVLHTSLTLFQHKINKSFLLKFDITDKIVNDLIVTVERRKIANIVDNFLPFRKLWTARFCL